MTAASVPIRGSSASIHRHSNTYFDEDPYELTSFVFDRPQARQHADAALQSRDVLYHEVTRDVWALASLPDNWDGYGAQSVDHVAQRVAISLLVQLIGFDVPKPDILPTANGGVALEWENNQINLAIEIDPYRDVRACIWTCSDDEREGPLEYLTTEVSNAFTKLMASP